MMKVVRDAIVMKLNNQTTIEEIQGCFFTNIFFVIDGDFKNEKVVTAINRFYPKAQFIVGKVVN